MLLPIEPIKFLATDFVHLPQWLLLQNLCQGFDRWPSNITVAQPLTPEAVDVIERLEKKVTFWYQRHISGPRRMTTIDRYGLVGITAINPYDRRIIVTEGVSDFITTKLCYPDLNVVGFTTLGGNRKAHQILLSLAKELIVVADNDSGKERNTGLLGAIHIKQNFERRGVKVSIIQPELPFKDITQQFIAQLNGQL